MPHVQPEASVVQVGLGIRYIGTGQFQHCYAYSGVVNPDQDETTVLSFTTGAGYIVSDTRFMTPKTGPDDYHIKIKLNDIIVVDFITFVTDVMAQGVFPYKLLIPPLTKVEVTMENTSSNAAREWTVTFSGRVYGVK